MAAGAESSHVQVDERHHDEGKGGGGQARAPVVHAEILKEKHRTPVVKRWLLQPRMPVEIRGNAGAEPAFQCGGSVEPVQHFMGDVGVSWLVRAHQSPTVTAKDGRETVSEEESCKDHKHGCLADGSPFGQPSAPGWR